MKLKTVTAVALAFCLSLPISAYAQSQSATNANQNKGAGLMGTPSPLSISGGKTFELYENIECRKVSFSNRFGIEVVGDLYLPENFNANSKYAGIITSHPYGGVKEQSGGLYAQEMAAKGFVSLAIDLSYNGESGGNKRHISTPEGYVEDIMAAVDYLGTRNYIDRERIGLIGICGSGAFGISAASVDPRIKAVASVVMVDMGGATRMGPDEVEVLKSTLNHIGEQRWAEFAGADTEYVGALPEIITDELDSMTREFAEYYKTPRGQHIDATGANSLNSTSSLVNFFPFANLNLLAGRPVLFITGENALSRGFSEGAYEMAFEPKELHIVPGVNHTDLYDNKNLIPFDKLDTFFKENLK